MPVNPKITRAAITDAALEVLRESGFSAISARNVARKLGCSTQPIYRSFGSMNERKTELTSRVIEPHAARVRASLRGNGRLRSHDSDDGIGFVRFAEQEKRLYRENARIGSRRVFR